MLRGLIKVIDDLNSKGVYSFPAFDDHSPVDLICMFDNGEVLRLQIKYRSKPYEIHKSSVVNGKRVKSNLSLIDGWAVYLSDENRVTYVPKSLVENNTNSFRVKDNVEINIFDFYLYKEGILEGSN